MYPVIVAIAFSFLAVMHSVLGEREILRPIFDGRLDTPGVARWAMERILRFAWHLTSVTWFAVAAIALGAAPMLAIGLGALASAGLVFVMLRGHLAWPIFLVAGTAALLQQGHVAGWVIQIAAWSGVAIATAVAVIHVYWGFGGRRGIADAVPHNASGEPLFSPGPMACVSVSVALGVFAIGLAATTLGTPWAPPRWTVALVAGSLVLRAIGDGRFVGFSKSVRESRFARLDDEVYTPLVVAMALASGAALLA